MIADTPLFAPNCSEETAAKAKRRSQKKRTEILPSYKRLPNQGTEYVALPLKLISQRSLGPAHS